VDTAEEATEGARGQLSLSLRLRPGAEATQEEATVQEATGVEVSEEATDAEVTVKMIRSTICISA